MVPQIGSVRLPYALTSSPDANPGSGSSSAHASPAVGGASSDAGNTVYTARPERLTGQTFKWIYQHEPGFCNWATSLQARASHHVWSFDMTCYHMIS
jgi:hypothetical protein